MTRHISAAGASYPHLFPTSPSPETGRVRMGNRQGHPEYFVRIQPGRSLEMDGVDEPMAREPSSRAAKLPLRTIFVFRADGG